MADLYPTKTRLELLRAADAGEVVYSPLYRMFFDGDGRKASTRVREQIEVGWLTISDRIGAEQCLIVELTDAGRKVLEGAPDA